RRPHARPAPGALAGARDTAAPEARPQTARPDGTHVLRAHRARLGVRGLAFRAGARGRPVVHARGQGDHGRVVDVEPRRVAGELGPLAARRALSWRTGAPEGSARPRRA